MTLTRERYKELLGENIPAIITTACLYILQKNEGLPHYDLIVEEMSPDNAFAQKLTYRLTDCIDEFIKEIELKSITVTNGAIRKQGNGLREMPAFKK